MELFSVFCDLSPVGEKILNFCLVSSRGMTKLAYSFRVYMMMMMMMMIMTMTTRI